MRGRVSQGELKYRVALSHTWWVSLCSGLPSVATYDLLTSLEDVLNPCDVAKFKRVIITIINNKSIRILNISVEKRLTNDHYKFLELRNEWEA